MKIVVDRKDIELIAKIESLGTWEKFVGMFDAHNSYDLWTWNGDTYKIWADSEAPYDDDDIDDYTTPDGFENFILEPTF